VHVVLIDPNPSFREALRRLLDDEPDLRVVASLAAVDGTALSESIDVAVVDERAAGAVGTAATSGLKTLTARAPVVVIGMGDPLYYEDAHVAAGAVGYWPKYGDTESLVGLVRAAALVARADRACFASRGADGSASAVRRDRASLGEGRPRSATGHARRLPDRQPSGRS
jgi:DNA-binding NarL/FixJ family response regulator